MLRTLTGRILLVSLLPLVIALAASGLVLGVRYEAYHLGRMHADLAHEAELMGRLIAPALAEGRTADVSTTVQQVAGARPDADLVVADASGAVVAPGRHRIPDSPEGRATLSELQAAVSGQTVQHAGNGFGDEGMFVAIPIREGSQIVGALHLSYDVTHVAALTRELRLTVLTAVIIAGALATLVALALARSVTWPVDRLAQAAIRLSDGHLDERVEKPPTVELGMLASAFNHLAARLQSLESARRHFLADVSHDLRAPVGAIQAAAETLLAGAEDEPELRHRLLTGIGGEMRRLTRLTSDLLEIARFEAGRLEVHRTPMPIGALVKQIADGFAGEAAERGIALTVDAPPTLPLVEADPDRLGQILANLLTNALKFTPSGGRVGVRLGADRTHVAIAVSDSGAGIPPDELPRLFDRFYQAGDGQPDDSGLGLGLAIVKALVEAHDGRVAVESSVGAGTTFTVLLPRADTPAPLPAL